MRKWIEIAVVALLVAFLYVEFIHEPVKAMISPKPKTT
jgi:hypothetical protein